MKSKLGNHIHLKLTKDSILHFFILFLLWFLFINVVLRLQSVDSTEELDRNPLFTTTILIVVTNHLCLYRQRVIFKLFSMYCLPSCSLIMWENLSMFSVFNGNNLSHFLHWNFPSLALNLKLLRDRSKFNIKFSFLLLSKLQNFWQML